ncbi:MAG TPA: hypothetical protein VGQ39_06340 [Pyrinomonadaceae bacterium]|jgi:tetratricopeptide (TPR) repeat protein|nr:hypothetical protein [Pyrinomonadaceae bacterium]
MAPRSVAHNQETTEATAYKNWYEAYTAGDTMRALELANTYLTRFTTGEHADYLKKWIPRIRTKLLNEAVTKNDLPEIDRLGKEIMAADPQNLDFALFLAGRLRTLDTNSQYSADTAQFAQTAIRLIEGGKTTTANPDAPFNKTKALGYLYDTLASIDERNKNLDKALDYYEQATKIDTESARHFFNCGRIHQLLYLTAADEYRSFPEADRNAAQPKPRVKTILEKVQTEADGVIECWVRFMQLPDNDFALDVKKQVMTALTELYKYRHPDSPDGLLRLIPNTPQ